jgi:chromosome segregation ATPase
MIVRTANLSLVVEDTEQALDDIEDLATELEGYVSNLQTWRVNEQLAATVTLRVPERSFGEARERIKALATELEAENVSGQDVTEEYVDLEARLHNLEVAETELLELLASAQETRQDAESILAIYREVTNIRQQIEQIQGRMQYLENATSLATLSVSLTPEEEEEPVVEPGWDPLRQARDALRALVNTLKILADLLIWLVLFILPMVALLALPFVLIWLGWFLWRRRRRRSKES